MMSLFVSLDLPLNNVHMFGTKHNRKSMIELNMIFQVVGDKTGEILGTRDEVRREYNLIGRSGEVL